MASELNKLLDLIDETLNYVQQSNEGKLIFITARSAGGKTTLGEAFKTLDFIHFDVDQFSYGFGDPVLDSGKILGAKKMKKNKEVEEAWALAREATGVLIGGGTPELSAMTPFYKLVLDEVERTRTRYPGKHMVITHYIPTRSLRDWIRNTMDGNVTFIILNPDVDLLGDRAVKRLDDIAKEMGTTPQGYLDSIADAINHKLKAEEIKAVTDFIANGFEVMQKDEPNTYQIDIDANMNKTDVFDAAKKIVFELM